jgi:hypothetical protein
VPAAVQAGSRQLERGFKLNTKSGLLAALALGAMLAACASTGTKVTSSSDGYRDMAKSQQWWCGNFGSSCQCTIDGLPATCSLVQACLSSGNCAVAK